MKEPKGLILEWISHTPLWSETFLEVWEWIGVVYSVCMLFTVFRFSFHALRGATEEFMERSRLIQFIFRWWRPLLAGHLIWYALNGAYNSWFFVAIFLLGLGLATINLILQFSIERLERKIQAYEEMERERKRQRESEEESDAEDDDDSEGDSESDSDGEGDGDRKRD